MDKKVEIIYNEEFDNEEISNIIDLIKLEDNNDFYKAFERQISYFLKLGEDIKIFDFKYQKKLNIFQFFFNYINSAGLSIYKIKKKEKPKKTIENKTIKKDEKTNNAELNESITKNKSNIEHIHNISHKLSKSSFNISHTKSDIRSISESKSLQIDSKFFYSFSEKSDLNISSGINGKKEEDKKDNSINVINLQEGKDKLNVFKSELSDNANKLDNLNDNSKENNQSTKKEKVIKEINFSKDEMEKNQIKFYDELSGLEGGSFEADTIKFIFARLLSISKDKNYSLLYDFKPDKKQLNAIFKRNHAFEIDDIQMDFVILNLKVSDFIELLIDIFPFLHSNSKINFDMKDKNIITLDDLNKLKYIKKDSDEKIDIIGEIGINVFNEDEKCKQLIKYTKIIHNINKMIFDNSEDLPYLLDILHFAGENKKLILFISDSTYSNFKNNKNNNFLKIQKILNVNSLLLYRNKNLLFRTKLLKTLFKQFKKEEKQKFNTSLDNEFEKIIKNIFKSNIYEGIVRKLSIIEKKIFNIKNDLYNYAKENNNFKNKCADIIEFIENKEIININMEKYKEIKDKLFKNVMKTGIEPETKIYIIYEKKMKKLKNLLPNF